MDILTVLQIIFLLVSGAGGALAAFTEIRSPVSRKLNRIGWWAISFTGVGMILGIITTMKANYDAKIALIESRTVFQHVSAELCFRFDATKLPDANLAAQVILDEARHELNTKFGSEFDWITNGLLEHYVVTTPEGLEIHFYNHKINTIELSLADLWASVDPKLTNLYTNYQLIHMVYRLVSNDGAYNFLHEMDDTTDYLTFSLDRKGFSDQSKLGPGLFGEFTAGEDGYGQHGTLVLDVANDCFYVIKAPVFPQENWRGDRQISSLEDLGKAQLKIQIGARSDEAPEQNNFLKVLQLDYVRVGFDNSLVSLTNLTLVTGTNTEFSFEAVLPDAESIIDGKADRAPPNRFFPYY